jgi:hypothetical protein
MDWAWHTARHSSLHQHFTLSSVVCGVSARVCLSNPCKNGGMCIQASPGQYTCKCLPQFTGDHCQERAFRAAITNTGRGDFREGDDLNLQCQIKYPFLYPKVEYTWLFHPYTGNDKLFAVIGHSVNYTATGINPIEDNGRYVCIASSGEEISRASIVVDIKPAKDTRVAADAGMDPAMQVCSETESTSG